MPKEIDLYKVAALVDEYPQDGFPKDPGEQQKLILIHGYPKINGKPIEKLEERQVYKIAKRIYDEAYKNWNKLSNQDQRSIMLEYKQSVNSQKTKALSSIEEVLLNDQYLVLAARIVTRFPTRPIGEENRISLIKTYINGRKNTIDPDTLGKDWLGWYACHIHRLSNKALEHMASPEREVLLASQKLEEKLKESYKIDDCKKRDLELDRLEEQFYSEYLEMVKELDKNSIAYKVMQGVLGLKKGFRETYSYGKGKGFKIPKGTATPRPPGNQTTLPLFNPGHLPGKGFRVNPQRDKEKRQEAKNRLKF